MPKESARRTNRLKSGVVDGLGDLLVGPAQVAQLLNLLIGDLVSVAGDRLHELEELPVRGVQVGRVQVTRAERAGGLAVLLALQLQEPGVRAESIPAAVEGRDIGEVVEELLREYLER